MTEGGVDAVALAQQAYGVTSDDLRVTSAEDRTAELSRSRQADEQVQALISRLTETGLETQEPAAYRVAAPVADQVFVVDWLRWSLTRNGQQVGEFHDLTGPAGSYTYAVVPAADGGAEFTYIQAGAVERSVIDQRGGVVESSVATGLDLSAYEGPQPRQISCNSVCNVVCAGGFAGTIPRCAARCVAAGPGYAYCVGLCTVIVGLGCLVGCDRICAVFGG